MLLMKDMSEVLRPDFVNGEIGVEDLIPVRVLSVDPTRGKVLLGDREDTDSSTWEPDKTAGER